MHHFDPLPSPHRLVDAGTLTMWRRKRVRKVMLGRLLTRVWLVVSLLVLAAMLVQCAGQVQRWMP